MAPNAQTFDCSGAIRPHIVPAWSSTELVLTNKGYLPEQMKEFVSEVASEVEEYIFLPTSGHTNAGLNGETYGTGSAPDMICNIAPASGLSLVVGCEQASPNNKSFLASSPLYSFPNLGSTASSSWPSRCKYQTQSTK